MSAPVRLQLSRRKGFDLQALSRAVNGLECVSVARPGKWENRYVCGPAYQDEYCSFPAIDAPAAVALHREHLEGVLRLHHATGKDLLAPLRGRNLGCWCKAGDPCHADTYLELANR